MEEVSWVEGAGVVGAEVGGAGVVGAGVWGAGVVGAGVGGTGVVCAGVGGAGVEMTASKSVSVDISKAGVDKLQVKVAFQSEFNETFTICHVESADMLLINVVSVMIGPFVKVYD